MDRLIEFFLPAAAGSAFPMLAEGAFKGTVVLAVAALLVFALQRSSAARRHLIWACALGTLALMPALLAFLPAWKVRSPVVAWLSPVEPAPVAVSAATAGDAVGDLPGATSEASGRTPAPESGAETGASIAPVAPQANAAAPAARGPIDWRSLAVLAWALGAGLVLAVFVTGHLVLRTLSRDARWLRSGEWHDLALEAADQLGLTLPFALLQGRGVPVPVTFGLFRPRLLLPPEAGEWPRERRRSVLLHELAHVQRYDCLTQAVAQLACALFWFHPAVWWAAARLRVERERACDDRVLASRTRASDYADHLLDVVRSLRATRLAALGAVAFARRSSLEGRLIAVLDPERDRRAVHLRNTVSSAVLAALVALPLAALEPGRVEALAKDAGKAHDVRTSDPTRDRPSRVERRTGGSASLDAGMAWARDGARGAGERNWWIGWRIGTSSKLEGGLLGDTWGIDIAQLSARGHFTLDDVIAGRERGTSGGKSQAGDEHRPAALLVRMSDGALARVRAQSFELPVDFAGEPLYWLEAIPTDQTFAWLRMESTRARDVRLRSQLVESAGYLDRSDLVLPFLYSTLDGNDPSEVRGGAAQAIAWHPSPEGMRRLNQHARNDRSAEVRRACVEALGRFQTPEALEALLALARDADEETRRQAFDAMGEKVQTEGGKNEARPEAKAKPKALDAKKPAAGEPAAKPYAKGDATAKPDAKGDPTAKPPDEGDLAAQEWDSDFADEPSVAMDPDEHKVQRQVIESLGRYPESESLLRLKHVAETSPSADLRREAVESIARIGTPAAIDLLQKVVWTNRHSQARMTAVELLPRVLPGEQALDLLEKIASSHPSRDTRRVAVEAAGRIDSPRALELLVKTIHGGADAECMRQAVESLGRRRGEGIDGMLLQIAKSHPVEDVRREAVEVIGRRGGAQTLERLLTVVREEGPQDVRRQAVESIGRLDDPRVKKTLVDLAWHGPTPEVARQAVESLGRIDEDTMADLAAVARSHPSGDVRRQAVESMSRRDPEQAIQVLDEILKQPKKKGGV